MTTKCGLVALVGMPNVGKSTLMNALVGERVAIISSKANTTRLVVRGTFNMEETQVVLVDTPGLNASTKAFDRMLVQQARGALADADVIAVVIDGERGFDKQALAIVEDLKKSGQTALLVVNKIDRIKKKSDLMPLLARANDMGVFKVVIPVSALQAELAKSGIVELRAEMARLVPEGAWLFDADTVTDVPLPLQLAELTREQVMRRLHEEIPYGVAVVTEGVGEGEDGVAEVTQRIVVSRENHKGMVVGKGGQMLKELGSAARLSMKEVLGRPVRLNIVVRVEEKWMERQEWLAEMGLK